MAQAQIMIDVVGRCWKRHQDEMSAGSFLVKATDLRAYGAFTRETVAAWLAEHAKQDFAQVTDFRAKLPGDTYQIDWADPSSEAVWTETFAF